MSNPSNPSQSIPLAIVQPTNLVGVQPTGIIVPMTQSTVNLEGTFVDKITQPFRETIQKLEEERNTLSKKYQALLEKSSQEGEQLRAKIRDLEAQIAKQNQEIAKQNEELAKQNEEIAKQNQEIARQNEEIAKQNQEIQNQNQLVKKEFAIIRNEMFLQRCKLIMGSISYNFVNRIGQLVFGLKKFKNMKNQIHSIDDIRNSNKTNDEENNWQTFLKKYQWLDSCEETLEKLASDRVSIAHPTTENDADDECPTPDRLITLSEKVYVNKKSKTCREHIKIIVNILDAVSCDLKSPLLV